MPRTTFGLIAALAALLLAGCGSSTTSATGTPSASASPSSQATPATTDPCQLVTGAEASQLAGTSYGAGKEETTSGGGKVCWYGAQTVNVFEVIIAVASSPSAAQAQWDQEKSMVESQLQQATSEPGLKVSFNIADTSIAGADRAAVGTFTESLGGHTISGTAVYLLKGSAFFAMTDLVLDHPAPTTDAMKAQAQVVIGRLP